MPSFQICIDGYAACGKSTLARGLADELEFLYIDSGAMYRGVTLYFLDHGLSFDHEQLDSVIQNINIEFEYGPASDDKLLLNGKDVSSQLRSEAVNENVSKVAAMSNVRRRLVSLQQKYGDTQNVVMDGRDIGTVVFPDAILKLFLTAGLETRILRRMNDSKLGDQKSDYSTIKANLIKRDHIDSTRDDSPLIQAQDAVLIDNTNLTIREQLALTTLLAKIRIG